MRELVRGLFLVQAYVSVASGDHGIAALRRELKLAISDDVRLQRGIALSQLLLIEKQYANYAVLASEVIAPLAAKQLDAANADAADSTIDGDWTIYSAGAALLPMFRTDFVAQLTAEQRETLIHQWNVLSKTYDSDTVQFGCNAFLAAAYEAQGNSEDADRARKRLHADPQAEELSRLLRVFDRMYLPKR